MVASLALRVTLAAAFLSTVADRFGDCVLGMRRRHPHDWRTNISRGAIAEPLELTNKLIAQARLAAKSVGTTVVGVDFLPRNDGQLYAIEVNAVPGWKALSKVTGVDVADWVLRHLQEIRE